MPSTIPAAMASAISGPLLVKNAQLFLVCRACSWTAQDGELASTQGSTKSTASPPITVKCVTVSADQTEQ